MGKIKRDDKSSIPGNFCKTEVRPKCKGDDAHPLSSVISSVPKKSRSEDLKLPKNNRDYETFDPHSSKVKGARMSRARENRIINSHSILHRMAANNKEFKNEIFTTKVKEVKETVINGCYTVASKSKSEVTSSRPERLMDDESSWRCSDDEQPTFTRLKRIGIPAVRIQRLNGAEPALFSLPNKHDCVEIKSATAAVTNKEGTELAEGQTKNCKLLDSDESDCQSSFAIDNRMSDTFEVKQEKDCEDGYSARVTEVADAKHRNGKASSVQVNPLSAKCDGEEMKSDKQSSDSSRSKCCKSDGGKGLTEDKQSNLTAKNAAASDDSCNDVVVLSVDSSRSKAARKSKSDMNRKRGGTNHTSGSLTMPTKQEPSTEQNAATLISDITSHGSSEVYEHEFIYDTPNKVAKTSSKNVGAKSAKKTRATKSSTFPGHSVSPSVLTRSMIKIPG